MALLYLSLINWLEQFRDSWIMKLIKKCVLLLYPFRSLIRTRFPPFYSYNSITLYKKITFLCFIYISRISLNRESWLKLLALTWIGLSIAVRPSRWRSVTCFHLECVGALLLTIEDDLREDFAALQVDLEELFALVARWIHDVVVHLRGGRGAEKRM